MCEKATSPKTCQRQFAGLDLRGEEPTVHVYDHLILPMPSFLMAIYRFLLFDYFEKEG
jgi:hypothetical protein